MQKNQGSLIGHLEERLRLTGLISPGSTIVLAVSGGIDSMVMLHLFANLQTAWQFTLMVAHINHKLRGTESDEDEAFVEHTSKSCGVAFYCKRVDTVGHAKGSGLSIQEAARNLRYEFFEDIRQRLNADVVATAHQADDNAETVLMNALRGTGIRGLAGIPERREPGRIIRPLLFVRRKKIEEYAQANGITYRNDSSNASTKYTRNYLRQIVVPQLESAGSIDVIASLNDLSSIMRQLDAVISEEVRASIDVSAFSTEVEAHVVDINLLRSKDPYLQEAIVIEVLRRLGSEIDADKVHRVLGLCDLESGSVVQLSKMLHVYRDRDRLSFVRPDRPEPLHQMVSLGDSYTSDDFRFSLSTPLPRPASFGPHRGVEHVDAARLGDQLLLRSWREGDWFVPLGMTERKKVSDFFIDEKIPLFQKGNVPILESDGSIVWICGKRLDDRFKVTSETTAVIRLEYYPTPHHH